MSYRVGGKIIGIATLMKAEAECVLLWFCRCFFLEILVKVAGKPFLCVSIAFVFVFSQATRVELFLFES